MTEWHCNSGGMMGCYLEGKTAALVQKPVTVSVSTTNIQRSGVDTERQRWQTVNWPPEPRVLMPSSCTHVKFRPVQFPVEQATRTEPSVINMETDSVFCSNTAGSYVTPSRQACCYRKLYQQHNTCTARHGTQLACDTNTRRTRVIIRLQQHAVYCMWLTDDVTLITA